jgi:5-methylcytosine-specific restriction endonuclease McrA
MRVVQPDERCSLFVDVARLPYNFGTARAVFYHLMKGHGVGIDANGNPFTYDDMINRSMAVYADQPVIRSAPIAGKETVWVLPTVFICNSSFFRGKNRKKAGTSQALKTEKVTAKQLMKRYGGICQFCLNPVRTIAEASHDHNFPRSLGGTDGYENAVLMHKNCNSNLGSAYPKFNVEGELIVPKKVYATGFFVPDGVTVREEWKSYLFLT